MIKKYKESQKYEDNLKTMKKIEQLEEDLENAYKTIDIFTKNKYDSNNFDIYGNHKDTGNKYDSNGFDRNGYNVNGVDKYSLDKDGNNINGIKGTRKNIQKEKFIIASMIMAQYMISMGLIHKNSIKMVMICMDLIKMD